MALFCFPAKFHIGHKPAVLRGCWLLLYIKAVNRQKRKEHLYAKKCEDNYFTTFSSPVVMLDYHEQLERESKWHRCKVNTLQVEPLNESSPLYGNLSAFASGISQDAVEDTAKT